MGKLIAEDLEAIRDSIKHSGEVRFHIIYSRRNLSVVCRLWHPDGHVLGRANGGGYDRAGAALGQAIEKLFPAELLSLRPGYACGRTDSDGVRGLTHHTDGTASLDGSCGIEQMLKVLVALGFTRTDKYETGANSSMVLARKQ